MYRDGGALHMVAQPPDIPTKSGSKGENSRTNLQEVVQRMMDTIILRFQRYNPNASLSAELNSSAIEK